MSAGARARSEAGSLLLQAVFFLGLVAMAIAAASTIRVGRFRAQHLSLQRTQALYVAESGVAHAIAQLVRDSYRSEFTGRVGEGRYTADVERQRDGWVVIRSRGELGDATREVTVEGRLGRRGFVVHLWR